MQRLTHRLAIAVLTFIIGLTVAWVVGLYPMIEDFLVDKLSAPPSVNQGTK
jgi:hypothetical protein